MFTRLRTTLFVFGVTAAGLGVVFAPVPAEAAPFSNVGVGSFYADPIAFPRSGEPYTIGNQICNFSALAETGPFRVTMTVTEFGRAVFTDDQDQESIGPAVFDPGTFAVIPTCTPPVTFTMILPHGLYFFTLVVDPDGVTGDLDTSNNTVGTEHDFDL